MSHLARYRGSLIFGFLALITAFMLTRGLVARPGFTDAYYHFNAAQRLVSGDGLTDPYLWTYIGAPSTLPAPSHTYWMPLTSLAAAFGMWALNASGNYAAAQWPFALMLAATAGVGFWLGGRIGGTRRHAWIAGLLVLFSGFYARFWGATDTFAPYALAGSLSLVFIGRGVQARESGAERWALIRPWLLAGLCAGLGHLARADGLLLLLVGIVALLWPVILRRNKSSTGAARTVLISAAAMIIAYLIVMTPWFVRNLDAVGSPLPVGGAQGMWYREYNELFNYPPGASARTLFADGIGTFVESRWLAFTNNLGTFIAVEGLVVMAPLMLIGLWNRRKDGFLRGFWLYALGLHLAMTFIFPFPGYRGGLFHSSAALVPWWAALGIAGLDDTVDWMAKRRRHWRVRTAKSVFSGGLVVLAALLTLNFAQVGRVSDEVPGLYVELATILPSDARVMINDPAQLYYFTGLWGVVLPNAAPETMIDIAQAYGITHLLIEYQERDGERAYAMPRPLIFDVENPPDFLLPIQIGRSGVRLYAIAVENAG